LLIDENLPAGLAARLGCDCEPPGSLGSQPGDDAIWDHARAHGLVIVTKDVDFFNKLAVFGAPPKVVWIRTGNLRRRELEDYLAGQWPRIEALLDQADLVAVHAGRLEAMKF
jgi:predicted nuclease of predicted toxin-antitoxin system